MYTTIMENVSDTHLATTLRTKFKLHVPCIKVHVYCITAAAIAEKYFHE